MGGRHAHRLGSEKKHRLEEFVIPVDYLPDRAYICKIPLSMCLVDLEKVFDMVNWARLLEVLQGYGKGPDMLEAIHCIYINTRGQVAGDHEFFCLTMGGC